MTSPSLLLVSADGHVGPPTEKYRHYLDPGLENEFDAFVATHKYRWTAERDESFFRRAARNRQRSSSRVASGGLDSLFDPDRRLKELDEDGVVAEVLFPDDQNLNTPPWLAGIAPQGLDRVYPPSLRLAGARAYNRWLAEFCGAASERLIGMIALGSLDDVDAAVREVRRAHASGLSRGILLPLDYYLPLYHHARYEPLWSICEELELVVTVHGSDGGPHWYGEGLRASAIYLTEVMWYAHRPLWCLILGGVFDCHPDLRVAFTEQGSSWVPPLLAQLDASAESTFMRWTEETPLSMKPSDYFSRHCVIGNSILTPAEITDRHAVGINNLAWGSDFPHYESQWPHTKDRLVELFAGVPTEESRSILGENLVDFYRLDRSALLRLADQIGPTPAELGLSEHPG